MKRLSRLAFGSAVAVLATVFPAVAVAHDGPHRAGKEASTPASWDFTLATLDGTRFVQAASIPGPVLVNFWGRECAPCVAELPRLQAFARDNPNWTVLLVATDPPAEASAFLQQQGIASTPTFTALRSGASVGGLMRAAGNRQGGLPFSLVVRSGAVCRTQLGEISESALAAAVAECGLPSR